MRAKESVVLKIHVPFLDTDGEKENILDSSGGTHTQIIGPGNSGVC